MKTKLLLAALCAASFGVCSCEHISNEDVIVDKKQTKDVQFVMKGISEEYSTRATIQSVECTDMWVYEGTTLLKHQVSTDEDFGVPTVSLTYGSHDITFVASKADGQTFSTTWACSKVKDTFGKVMNVTVSGGSSTSRQVELTRRSAQVVFTIQDAIPTEVKKMHLKVSTCMGLYDDLSGGSATNYEVTADVSSKAGVTGYAPVVNVLPASATDEEDCDVMIEFLSADGTALYHYERTIKLKANRATNLTGKYFSGEINQVSVKAEWDDELQVNL